jgi:hypothetical protein
MSFSNVPGPLVQAAALWFKFCGGPGVRVHLVVIDRARFPWYIVIGFPLLLPHKIHHISAIVDLMVSGRLLNIYLCVFIVILIKRKENGMNH